MIDRFERHRELKQHRLAMAAIEAYIAELEIEHNAIMAMPTPLEWLLSLVDMPLVHEMSAPKQAYVFERDPNSVGTGMITGTFRQVTIQPGAGEPLDRWAKKAQREAKTARSVEGGDITGKGPFSSPETLREIAEVEARRQEPTEHRKPPKHRPVGDITGKS